MNAQHQPIAVVVGLCPHGVALARNLQSLGYAVHALESNASLPGVRTRAATVHIVDDVNSDRLARNLLWLREHLDAHRPPLFLTNDRMVAAVARQAPALREGYEIPWADGAQAVLDLLSKDKLEAFANTAGLRYPRSLRLADGEALASVARHLRLPIILKPCQPLSGMKTLVVHGRYDLEASREDLQDYLPLLAQEYVAGPEHYTRFAVLALRNGQAVARFEGKKLRSKPLGHTTVAIAQPDDWLHEATLRFFASTGYSGLASLEMKRDPDGEFWVIEPTVGRSDFWIDLCLQEQPGLLTAALASHEKPQSAAHVSGAHRPTVWFNSERDKQGLAWVLRHHPRFLLSHRFRFAYLSAADPRPFLSASARYVLDFSRRLRRKVLGSGAPGTPASDTADDVWLETGESVEALDDACRTLLRNDENAPFYGNLDWYTAFTRHIVTFGRRQRWFALRRGEEVLALLPMEEAPRGGLKVLRSMSNYYTPYFAPALADHDPVTRDEMLRALFERTKRTFAAYDVVEFAPLRADVADVIRNAGTGAGFAAHQFQKTVNWRLPGTTGYQAFLNGRPGQVRRTFERRLRKLERDFEVDVQILAGGDIDEDLAAYHDVYRRSWKVEEPYPEFISDVARTAARRGTLRLGILRVDGLPIAGQLWFVEHGTASIFKLAYDDAYKAYSPGTILTFRLLEHTMDIDRVTTVDYLTGDDRYKAQLMSEARPLYGLELSNLRRPGGLLHAARNRIGAWRSGQEDKPMRKPR